MSAVTLKAAKHFTQRPMQPGAMTAQQFDALAGLMRLRAGSGTRKAMHMCLVDGKSAYVASVSHRCSLVTLLRTLESACTALERIATVSPSANAALVSIRGDVGEVIEQDGALPLSAETQH